MTTDQLYNWLVKKYGKGEKQPFLRYDRMVKNPIRITKLIEHEKDVNELYFNLKNTLRNKIVRTRHGCIVKNDLRNACGVYDAQLVTNSKNNVIKGIIITVILRNHVWVFKCGRLTNREENTMTGAKAFCTLKRELKKDGVDLDKYQEDDGRMYKSMIDGYPIKNFILKKEVSHVNHIDLNQAWPSALAEKKPEFEKTFKRLDKSVLNSALGYCQSRFCGFKLSKLPMIAINDTNELILKMTAEMVLDNFGIVGFNTDGIWYYDKTKRNRLYHDKNEGTGLHHWKHDYIDVTFYAHSDGQYYIIDKSGRIDFKLRGYYQYETIKPRQYWDSTDDFFKAIASAVEVKWSDEKGLTIRSI